MTKAKKGKQLKAVKTNAPKKVKGVTLSLSNFGEISIDKKLTFQKDLALSLDALFSVEETIRKEIIPTLSKHFNTYINWLKKNSPIKYKELQMKDLKKYAWDLVGYKRKAGIGGARKVANESFEANVGRACKVALLMDKEKLTINKKGIIVGVSKDISPIRFFENSNGKEVSEPNTRTEIEKVRIFDIEDMFNRFVLGKNTKYSSKSSKKKTHLKDTKTKIGENTLAELLKVSFAKLSELNVSEAKHLYQKVGKTEKAYLRGIVQYGVLILAKLETLEVGSDNKVKELNENLFNDTQARKKDNVEIVGNAVFKMQNHLQSKSA